MTRLMLELPEEMEEKLRARATEAGYSDAGDFVKALIVEVTSSPSGTPSGGPSHLSFRNDKELERKLLERLDSKDAGEMTAADFDAIRAKVRLQGKNS